MHTFSSKSLCHRALGALAVAVLLAACGGGDHNDVFRPDSQVYAETNSSANSIVHMGASADGSLVVRNAFGTGGAGTNNGPDPLTSQYSVIVTPNRQTLFAVNGGDNSVSAFAINGLSGDLTLLQTNPTTGTLPVSLAYQQGILYVLFQGSQTIQAYPVNGGVLGVPLGSYAIANTVSAASKPTEITLSPDGQYLLVNAGTDSNTVDAFAIHPDGSLGTQVVNSNGIASPFASVFFNGRTVLLTNAAGHALQALDFNQGQLTAIGAPVVGDVQGAPCWLVITPDGRYAYAGNGGSGSISSYVVHGDGTLSLLNAQAASENLAVAGDAWISANGRYLYSAYLAAGVVMSYIIGFDGSLTKIGSPAVVTPGNTMQGLVGMS